MGANRSASPSNKSPVTLTPSRGFMDTQLLQRFQVLDEISSLGGGQAELHERVVVIHRVAAREQDP